jgi:tetratricopeptide (TPR) repeat protein
MASRQIHSGATHFLRRRFYDIGQRRWNSLLKGMLPFAALMITTAAHAAPAQITITKVSQPVHVIYPGENPQLARTGMVLVAGTTLNTEAGASAEIQWADGTKTIVQESSRLEIAPPKKPAGSWIARLARGALLLIGGASGQEPEFETPQAFGGTRGTEYQLIVETNRTVIRVREGEAFIVSSGGMTNLTGGWAAIVEEGQRPEVFALVGANTVEWWLNYPAVLSVDDLEITEPDAQRATEALTAWRNGDLRAAVEKMPARQQNESAGLGLFRAAVLLVSGDRSKAETLLEQLPESSPKTGIRNLIAAVALSPDPPVRPNPGATEWLGRSYLRQSRRDLEGALLAAKQAVMLSPTFGFGWARVAELEFSFGNARASAQALDRALALSPRNAYAHVLRGFVFIAENRFDAALLEFDRALALDPRSADARLGKGLIAFRSGDTERGLREIESAAKLHPSRSLFRGYLGKARAVVDGKGALEDFQAAQRLDPNDPTPWLYSALELYAQNRPNEAIASLERSIQLNNNRAVYRSHLLLDEDQAVRSASLARIYQRAGMPEVALREAARAVAFDYTSPSAHLFLADSFNALRDPTRFNLRYETAWFNEVLLANALSPVDAGILSPSLAHQEYARLFSADGLRLTTLSELRSDEQFRQLATHSGIFARSAYALDLDYQHNRGVRPNNDLDRTELYTQFKQQLTATDTAMILLKFQDYKSGDNFQYVDPALASPVFRYEEDENPIAYGVWRHDWVPGVKTLAAFGRLEMQQHFTAESSAPRLFYLDQSPTRQIADADNQPFHLAYENDLELWTGELQQIAQTDNHTLIAGFRMQEGRLRAADLLIGDPTESEIYGDLTGAGILQAGDFATTFRRLSLYAYETWRPIESLAVTAGLTWDHMDLPSNFRNPPLSDEIREESRLSPKAALVWTPSHALTVRGMYSRSLGGLTFDESYRLEPVQLAGFSQAYRTIIPESLVGSVSGHRLELGGAAVDLKLPSRTYFGLQATVSESQVDQRIGAFTIDATVIPPAGATTNISEELRYRELAFAAGVHQLVGDCLALGLTYGFSHVELETTTSAPGFDTAEDADLHSLRFTATFNFPHGWFVNVAANALWQSDPGSLSADEYFLPLDLEMGWRFPRQHGELSFGAMNLLNDDYRLAPLSALPEFPRERAVFARLRMNL